MRNKLALMLALASAILGLAACVNQSAPGTDADRAQANRLPMVDSSGGGGGGGGGGY